MWIRSQDKKTLINTNRFDVENTYIYVYEQAIQDGFIVIAKYKTEERALEILNQIQGFIDEDGLINGNKFRVFEMPEE